MEGQETYGELRLCLVQVEVVAVWWTSFAGSRSCCICASPQYGCC